MDTLLETLDSLRLMQKNHEENPNLYGFNYKQDLINICDHRERVFAVKRLEDNEADGLPDDSETRTD